MKYLDVLKLKVKQISVLSNDLTIKQITFTDSSFLAIEKEEDQLDDFNDDYAQELKEEFDIFFKNNPDWKENYFNIKQSIIQPVCSIISFKLLKKNSNDFNKLSDFDFKNYALNDVNTCFKLLISDQYDKKFKKQLEEVISDYGHLSYEYAKKINQRFILGEKEIMKEKPKKVNDYKDTFIGPRWKEYEDYLVKEKKANELHKYLQTYQINDPNFEDFFKKEGKFFLFSYYTTILNKDDDFFLSKPELAYLYLRQTMSARNVDLLKEKYRKFFPTIRKSPEACYETIIHFLELQEEFEPYIYVSPYWSYQLAKYLLFHGYETLESLNPLLVSSIKKNQKLYDKLLEINILRDDSGYSFEYIDKFKPEDFNETEVIR